MAHVQEREGMPAGTQKKHPRLSLRSWPCGPASMLAKLDVDRVDRVGQHAQQQLPAARCGPRVVVGDDEHGRALELPFLS